jgi:hypothetical protein
VIFTIAFKAMLSFVRHGVHMEFSSDGYTTTVRRLAFGVWEEWGFHALELAWQCCSFLLFLHNFVLYSCINYTLFFVNDR